MHCLRSFTHGDAMCLLAVTLGQLLGVPYRVLLLIPDVKDVSLLFFRYWYACCGVAGIGLHHRWVRLHVVRRRLEVLYFLSGLVAVLNFVLDVLVQITVSIVEFIGLFWANVKGGLLHFLGITYELLLVETRVKSAGATAAWMKELRFTRRPWQHVGIRVTDGQSHGRMCC